MLMNRVQQDFNNGRISEVILKMPGASALAGVLVGGTSCGVQKSCNRGDGCNIYLFEI